MYHEILQLTEKASRAFISILIPEVVFSGVLFAVVLGLAFVLRKRSPYWQYGLWTLILLRLLLPPDLHFSWSARSLLQGVAFMSSGQEASGGQLNEANLSRRPEADLLNTGKDFGTFFGSNFKSMPSLLMMFWLAGVILLFVQFIRHWLAYRRLIATAQTIEDEKVRRILHFWKKRLRVKRSVQLVSSDAYLSPFTVGVLRPTIFLPACLLQPENVNTWPSIIAHEMAHIKRLDDVWIRLQNVVQILYFFHPVVWYANSQVNLARERLCDRMVLTTRAISPDQYGKTLLTVLNKKLFGAESALFALAFGNQKEKITFRLKEITGGDMMKQQNRKPVFLTLIFLGIFLLPMAKSGVSSKRMSVNSNITKQRADFVLPINLGYVTADFGPTINPFTRKQAFHNGIDIAAKKGTEVYAVSDATVEKSVTDAELGGHYGKNIILQHGAHFQTRYGHLDSVLVKEGDKVNKGEVIGLNGNTGLSTGPHLHFEVIKDGENLNPAEVINFDRLRKKRSM